MGVEMQIIHKTVARTSTYNTICFQKSYNFVFYMIVGSAIFYENICFYS